MQIEVLRGIKFSITNLSNRLFVKNCLRLAPASQLTTMASSALIFLFFFIFIIPPPGGGGGLGAPNFFNFI